ncbi:hypothetical protein ACFFSH_22845 [Streptomyces filamentosus]|uniref:Uncharacterized protein n=1 Tax=Streptomyces filamentosus TaxID=67294 RepID=A0A919ESR9_STRFL|nr:hypothetical protein [Streptomyces filamentosus]GHG22217.1 hypothetical protein GCM10017667_67480 [Streptomyces filamentosus]
MKTTAVERRAELLRLYTGMSWQSARRRVEAATPGSLLIPQPDSDQMLLEARVMAALAWRRITTVHPWGIKYVDPRSDRLLIRFEADLAERRDPAQSQALDLAEALLPRADEYGDVKTSTATSRGCRGPVPTSRTARCCCACRTRPPPSPCSVWTPTSGCAQSTPRTGGWAPTA